VKPTVLSTKTLSNSALEILMAAGFEVTCYDAISITFIDFEAPEYIENAIFSSQNGVDSFFETTGTNTKIKHCFCVGEKTAKKLEALGQNVVKIAQNATELGAFIAKNYKNETFYMICGSRRRDEIPELLKREHIDLFELKTYKTDLNQRHFEQKWDKILFFSPSGVESYFLAHHKKNGASDVIEEIATAAICIGPTTAATAKKYMSTVTIAPSTTVESVLAETVKTMPHDED